MSLGLASDRVRLHRNYFEVTAGDYRELGYCWGKKFKRYLRRAVASLKSFDQRAYHMPWVQETLRATRRVFPFVVEEFEGCAQGAGLPLYDLWMLSMAGAGDIYRAGALRGGCTTVITNEGALIGHNEDWCGGIQDGICLVKKRVNDLTVWELFDIECLGGNAISVNSAGYVQAVNSLFSTLGQGVQLNAGVPPDALAKWLAQTRCLERDLKVLAGFERSGGYSHTFVGRNGSVCNVECTALEHRVTWPVLPFVHTNHFLTDLAGCEVLPDGSSSYHRYQRAVTLVKREMTVEQMMSLLSDRLGTGKGGIFNKNTVARTVIDLAGCKTYVWLRRESRRGWVEYDLDFLR